jgi:hypothetical protein
MLNQRIEKAEDSRHDADQDRQQAGSALDSPLAPNG